MIAGASPQAWLVRNPPHPGRRIAARMEPLDDYPGFSIAEAARKLGVSRGYLSRVIRGRSPVSLDLAMKMDALGWGTAENWMKAQARYDVSQERKRRKQPYAAAPAVVAYERMMAEHEAADREAEPEAARAA